MSRLVERRRFRRFEIPGGKIKIITGPGSFLLRPFLKSYHFLNMGMGGINILSTREFTKGEEFIIDLYAPEEERIKLRLRVIWTNPVPLSKDLVAGCEFFPFGEERYQNSPDNMNTLRRLYARYTKN